MVFFTLGTPLSTTPDAKHLNGFATLLSARSLHTGSGRTRTTIHTGGAHEAQENARRVACVHRGGDCVLGRGGRTHIPRVRTEPGHQRELREHDDPGGLRL